MKLYFALKWGLWCPLFWYLVLNRLLPGGWAPILSPVRVNISYYFYKPLIHGFIFFLGAKDINKTRPLHTASQSVHKRGDFDTAKYYYMLWLHLLTSELLSNFRSLPLKVEYWLKERPSDERVKSLLNDVMRTLWITLLSTLSLIYFPSCLPPQVYCMCVGECTFFSILHSPSLPPPCPQHHCHQPVSTLSIPREKKTSLI